MTVPTKDEASKIEFEPILPIRPPTVVCPVTCPSCTWLFKDLFEELPFKKSPINVPTRTKPLIFESFRVIFFIIPPSTIPKKPILFEYTLFIVKLFIK